MSHIPSSAMPHAHAAPDPKPEVEAPPAKPDRTLEFAALALGATVVVGALAAALVPAFAKSKRPKRKPRARAK